jgi:hypothetical protein
MTENKYMNQLESGSGKEEQLAFQKRKLGMVDETIEAYKTELEALTKIMNICAEKPRPLELKYEYEQDEEYWKAHVAYYKVGKQRDISDLNIKLLQAQEARDKVIERLKELEGD